MKRLLILAVLTLGLCRSAIAQTVFSDDFNRSNGNIGTTWWNGPDAIVNGEGPLGGASAGIQLLSNAYAPLTNFAGLAISSTKIGSYGNDQWAQASIAAIAPSTSVLAITAASQSGSNTTYTYTLSSGSALVMNQQIYVSGMAHGGNNSTVGFNITGLGAGTFTVVNASGVTATENGTGTSPSDSNTGLVLRGSADGQTCYFLSIGPNSGKVGGGGVSSDQRVYTIEIWKIVSGTTTILRTFTAPITSITDAANDIYTLTVTGTTLTLFHNGKSMGLITDAAIASGNPGIMSWAISGTGEWANPTFYDTGSGNNANQWTHWLGADFTATNIPYFDTFIGSNGTDLHTYNANWVNNVGSFQIQPNNTAELLSAVASNAMVSWQGGTFANDQWAQITTQVYGATQSIGPAVRVATSANTGYFYRHNTSNTRVLFKVIAGVYTQLAISNTAHNNVVGDVLRLVVIGTNLYAYLNGTLENFGVISDNSLSSGFPGMEAGTSGGTTTGAGFEAGNAEIGGNVGVASATVTLSGAGSGTVTSDANGVYAFTSGIVDGSYTVTPSLAGHIFTPTSLSVVVTGGLVFPMGENASQTGFTFNGSGLFPGASILPGTAIR